MKGLKDRINEIKDHFRLSNRGFAAEIGAKPAATNNYLNGTKEPSMDFVDAILSKYVDISAEWLLRGKGTMFVSDEPTSEEITRELADANGKMLGQEGISDRLSKIIENKIDNKQEFVKEKWEGKLG